MPLWKTQMALAERSEWVSVNKGREGPRRNCDLGSRSRWVLVVRGKKACSLKKFDESKQKVYQGLWPILFKCPSLSSYSRLHFMCDSTNVEPLSSGCSQPIEETDRSTASQHNPGHGGRPCKAPELRTQPEALTRRWHLSFLLIKH